MIISASRRTDIPAFYSEWFLNRIREKYVVVRNPFNNRHVSRVSLSPDVVDGIVFWTKNPSPMIGKLDRLRDYTYYFQFTLNPYGVTEEGAVPEKTKVVESFKRLADITGPQSVVWRYDPILFSPRIDNRYHIENFEKLASELSGYTEKCMVGFLDIYRKTGRNLTGTGIISPDHRQRLRLAAELSGIASNNNIELQICSENIDYSGLGILKGKCIDKELLSRIGGFQLLARKDRNQRPICLCDESIDIGGYDTCPHFCNYCYANRSPESVLRKIENHDPHSSMITGGPLPEEVITERKMKSLRRPVNDISGTQNEIIFPENL